MRERIIQCILFCFLILLFSFPSLCLHGAKQGLLLWATTIVPTLLPFMILTKLMIPYHPFHSDFIFTLVIGFLCGYPLGGKLVDEFVSNHTFTKKEGQYILPICNNVSPMFSVGYILPFILNHKISVFAYFTSLYFPNFLFLLFFLWKNRKKQLFFKRSETIYKKDSFSTIINNSLESIFFIGIYLMIFSISASLLENIPYFKPVTSIVIGCNEITTGLLHWKTLKIPFKEKTAAILAFSSFGGLCSIAQTKSVCKKSQLSMIPYILCKLLFAFLSFYCVYCTL